MNRSEEDFDDLLRELISDWFEAEGARLMEEAKRLSRDPAAAVPEDLEKRTLELISQQFSSFPS